MCLIGIEHENMGYCGENDNIRQCGPIWVRKDPKTQEESFSRSFRAWIESIKCSDERCQKVNLKTKKDAFWKQIFHICLVVCKRPFHRKTSLGPCRVGSCFSWFTFCRLSAHLKTPFKTPRLSSHLKTPSLVYIRVDAYPHTSKHLCKIAVALCTGVRID